MCVQSGSSVLRAFILSSQGEDLNRIFISFSGLSPQGDSLHCVVGAGARDH